MKGTGPLAILIASTAVTAIAVLAFVIVVSGRFSTSQMLLASVLFVASGGAYVYFIRNMR